MCSTIVTHKFATANGRELQLEIWPNAGAGTILFYPGTMLSPFQYRALLRALRQAGFAVAALHLTGHGASPHAVGFTFDDLLHDGLLAEDWLHQAGFGPIAVCGHSQGGILALAHAACSTKITAAFPITAVLPQTDEAIKLTRFAALSSRRSSLENFVATLARWTPRLPIPFLAYISPRRVFSGARSMETNHRKTRLTYPVAYLASLFTSHVSPRLRCPLWLFSARNDALFTEELIQTTFDRLETSEKRLVWLPGGGHLAAMNPPLCHFIARTTASACAGMGLPLRLERRSASSGDMSYGI